MMQQQMHFQQQQQQQHVNIRPHFMASLSQNSPSFGMQQQLEPSPLEDPSSNRKEKVKRYLEKKKNRKFQKTVRYASRKAYAEVRPRVKGRFVKRESAQAEAEGGEAGPQDDIGEHA